MTALLPAILPVSLIIFIGFLVGRTLPLEQQALSQLSIYVLSPALIAGSLYRTTLSTASAIGLVVGYAIASLLLYLTVLLLSHLLKLTAAVRSSLLATTLFANTGNMGLPLIAFSLGEAGLERAIVYLIASAIVIGGLAPAILQGSGVWTGLRLTLKLPLFWAMLGGVCLRLLAVELPFRLDDGVKMLGDAAIPVVLIVLGIQLARTPLQVGRYEIFAAGLRLLFAPAIAYGVGRVLGLAQLDLQVLVLQGAMPTAVSSLVYVAEFGGDAPRVARTIVVSTLLSFFTLPLVLWGSSGWQN